MEESEELMKNERDWSNLPADIIHLIAKKLPDILEFVCFRAVCKSWRSSAPLSDPPQQMPWLLEFSGNTFDPVQLETPQLRLYSIASGKTVTIPINKAGWFRGAPCHYLPFFDEDEQVVSLFNPLTQNEIVHPPIRLSSYALQSPWMVWTDTSPILDRDILLIDRDSLPNERGRWAFFDAQQKTWTYEEGYFHNFCYCQGKLFSASNSFETRVIDISSKKLLHTILPPEDGYHSMSFLWTRMTYLVESSGEVLAVCRFQPQHHKTIQESIFDIRKLDFGGEDGQPRWVRIRDIGNRILFLEVRNGFSMAATPSTTGFNRGGIYFIEPSGDLYGYHFVTGSIEKVPCPFQKCTWFLPGLN